MDREIYKCVRDNTQDGAVSYCGRRIYGEFCFLEPTHAVLNRQNKGRLLICKDCRNKITEIMEEE